MQESEIRECADQPVNVRNRNLLAAGEHRCQFFKRANIVFDELVE